MDILPCQLDPTSLTGLRRLVRDYPGTWHDQIPRPWPAKDAAVAEHTMAETLRSGLVDSLFPRWAGDAGRLRRARACATRLVKAIGDRPMAEVDDAFIEELRRALVDGEAPATGRTLSASTAARTLTVAREAARAWAHKLGRIPQVSGNPTGPADRIGDRRPRLVPTIWDVSDLLLVSPAWLRAVIGLACGAGMREGQIRWLCRGHIHTSSRRVVLLAGRPGFVRDPRRLRFTWIPPWAFELLEEACGSLHRLRPDLPLFPSPVRYGRPRSSLNGALRRACRDAWGDDGPAFTLGDLRRSWQAVCRSHRLPRAVVRQSWWTWAPPRGTSPRFPPGALQLQRVIARWKELGDRTADCLRLNPTVPVAAPSGTGPWEPEVRRTPARRPPLPESCVVSRVSDLEIGTDADDGTDR